MGAKTSCAGCRTNTPHVHKMSKNPNVEMTRYRQTVLQQSQGRLQGHFSSLTAAPRVGGDVPNMENEEDDVMTEEVPRRIARSMSKRDSVMAVPGREGQELTYGSGAGKCVGVFTSGGDSQGLLGFWCCRLFLFKVVAVGDFLMEWCIGMQKSIDA